MPGTVAALDREDAVRVIAETMAGRNHYLAVGYATPWLADALDRLPNWLAYLDSGTGVVMSIGAAPRYGQLLVIAGAVTLTAVIAAIPKRGTPPRILRKAFRNDELGRNKEQDMLLLFKDSDNMIYWPSLFVDAMAINDPKIAMQIHANDIRTLS